MLFLNRKFIAGSILIVFCLSFIYLYNQKSVPANASYIKWVDFKVSQKAMQKALSYDVNTKDDENHIDWITLLALCGEKCGGDFEKLDLSYMDTVAKRLKDGEKAENIYFNEKYFNYYKEAYDAVLSGFLGEHYIKNKEGEWEEKYDLKAFSPIAGGYGFSHYKDFGNSRSYGFKRKHLGNDLMGGIGTPIVAIESGIIEVMGWNRYGGWRIGIRSFDRQRYYYYAHLRKDFPFNTNLKEGDTVAAGDVIGYLGMTGYSNKENVNNINIAHLHFGMQIIFDEVQKDGNNEIWIDVYEIIEFLQKNKSYVVKNENDKNFTRKVEFFENNLKDNGG